MNSIQLVNFPVKLTIKISQVSEIKSMIDKFIEYYRRSESEEFSCRILLPRHLDSENDAKRLGATIHTEIMLSLKKNKLAMNLRDIRYIHDANTYGWLLLNPKVAEKL
ncbi:MAG: hypothetical protein EHM34_05535 [Nitrosopumilales archaeon]|nr:MAG: hypothetical protein EHM34_05535 [Nitrosopumilales archaeon]